MTPATINFPEPLVRGDTLQSFYMAFDLDRTGPLPVASARMQLRTKATSVESSGTLCYTWQSPDDITISIVSSKCRVTMAAIAGADSAAFPPKTLYYDLQLTLDSGEVITPIGGTLTVIADQTLPA